jgi:hypothetical protein
MEIRAISYGGGVQSTALLVLAARGEIDFPTALFANVGDDAEHPDTLRYVDEVAVPFARERGIDLRIVRKRRRDGSLDSLMARIERDSTTVPIPMRMSRSGAPGNRSCTAEFKIRPLAAELKRLGATRERPATVALGISVDEYQRMRSDSGIPYEVLAYPLIDLRMDRSACVEVIRREGLPVPPKSSCFFCPFHDRRAWLALMRDRPDLFEKAASIEAQMNERRLAMGRDEVWMTGSLRPLKEAITEDGQLDLWGGSCDIAGYCNA